eukprot:1329143-Lingulodinium_polyedra.AAC.1
MRQAAATGYMGVWADCRRATCPDCAAAAVDALRKRPHRSGGEHPDGADQWMPVTRFAGVAGTVLLAQAAETQPVLWPTNRQP